MHPIEHLRHVARAAGAGGALVASEAAGALAEMARVESPGLVPACRRLVDAHMVAGPVWWLSARVLGADDPGAAARQAARELDDDRTDRMLATALPDGATVVVVGWPDVVSAALRRRGDIEVLVVGDRASEAPAFADWLRREGSEATLVPPAGVGSAAAVADVVVLESLAGGPTGILATPGSLPAAAVAAASGRQVWAVAATGRVLPGRLWDALLARLDATGTEPWDREAELVPAALLDRVIGANGEVEVDLALQQSSCPVAPELLRPAG